MRLLLSRVQPEDFDALIPLMFHAFADVDLNNVFFGPKGPAGHAYAKRTVLHGYTHDAADVWMKVTDEDVDVEINVLDSVSGRPTGEKRNQKRIVAGSNWKVWPTLNREEHEKRNGGGPKKEQSEGSTNFDVTNAETTVSDTPEDE